MRLDKRRYANAEQRLSLLQRDGFRCQYCRTPLTNETANFDHVRPWKRGGRTKGKNLVSACPRCNKLKGNKSVTKFLKLLTDTLYAEETNKRLDEELAQRLGRD